MVTAMRAGAMRSSGRTKSMQPVAMALASMPLARGGGRILDE
jgi:hypothetical protein